VWKLSYATDDGHLPNQGEKSGLKAIEDAKRVLFQPDWKRVFETERWMDSIRRITTPPA